MDSASVKIIIAVEPGLLRSCRKLYLKSCQSESMGAPPQVDRLRLVCKRHATPPYGSTLGNNAIYPEMFHLITPSCPFLGFHRLTIARSSSIKRPLIPARNSGYHASG